MTGKKKQKRNHQGKLPRLSAVLLLVLLALPVFSLQKEDRCIVTGKVEDPSTGKGIEKVFVRFRHGGGRVYTETDKNGNFKFSKVHPGEVEIQYAPRPPYPIPLTNKPWDKFYVQEGKNLYIHKELECGAILYGKVLEKNTGELLKIETLAVDYHIPFAIELHNKGEFKVTQLEPGQHTLFFFVTGYGPREIYNIELKSGEKKEMLIYLDSSSPTKVVGKILCLSTNKPLSNAEFSLCSSDAEDLYSNAFTDSEGNFIIRDVVPGEYFLGLSGTIPNLPKTGENIIGFSDKVLVIKGAASTVRLSVDCNLDFDLDLGTLEN